MARRKPKQEKTDPGTQLLTQMVSAHGYNDTVKSLAKVAGYEEVPPTIDEFMDGADYLKNVLWNDMEDKTAVFPIRRAGLREIYPNPFYSPYDEIVLTGSLGGGKTWKAKIGVLYDWTKMLFLRSPQLHFPNLGKTTRILYGIYCETLKTAKGALFDELIEWIQSSPFLKSRLNEGGARKSMFQKNLDLVEGSRFTHTIGQAVGGVVLSELNFQNRVNNQAYLNYTANKRRMQTRFLTKWPGHMWLDSSKADEAAFLEMHIKQVQRKPRVRVFDYPIWVAKPDVQYQNCEMFKMFIGDDTHDPAIISHARQMRGLDESRVIEVPVIHYDDFLDDPYSAIRELAGKAVFSTHKFISSVEKIEEGLIRRNPVTKDIIALDFYDQSDVLIKYLLIQEVLKHKRPRFIHVDLGIRHDLAGIAMSCIIGFVTVTRRDTGTGEFLTTKEPIFWTDFVMALKSKAGQDVPIYKIKNFVRDLMQAGVTVASVTADGYQSENLKQDLWLMGVDSKIISVDKNRAPYDHFKNVLLEGRYNGVKHPRLRTELKNLLDLGDKIDHPLYASDTEGDEDKSQGQRRGSKDIADAVTGSLWNAYEQMEKFYGKEEFHEAYMKEIIDEGSTQADLYESIFNSAVIKVEQV